MRVFSENYRQQCSTVCLRVFFGGGTQVDVSLFRISQKRLCVYVVVRIFFFYNFVFVRVFICACAQRGAGSRVHFSDRNRGLNSRRDGSPLMTFNLTNQEIRAKTELEKNVVSWWRSMIAIFLNIGVGASLIKMYRFFFSKHKMHRSNVSVVFSCTGTAVRLNQTRLNKAPSLHSPCSSACLYTFL